METLNRVGRGRRGGGGAHRFEKQQTKGRKARCAGPVEKTCFSGAEQLQRQMLEESVQLRLQGEGLHWGRGEARPWLCTVKRALDSELRYLVSKQFPHRTSF